MKRLLISLFLFVLAPLHTVTNTMSSTSVCYEDFFDAIERDDVATIAALLAENVTSVDIRNDQDNTPLMDAALAGRTIIAQLLLEHKAQTDMPDSDGFTPLMNAVSAGNVAMTTLLLDYHANLELKNHNGQTALDIAHMMGHPQIVALLETAQK